MSNIYSSKILLYVKTFIRIIIIYYYRVGGHHIDFIEDNEKSFHSHAFGRSPFVGRSHEFNCFRVIQGVETERSYSDTKTNVVLDKTNMLSCKNCPYLLNIFKLCINTTYNFTGRYDFVYLQHKYCILLIMRVGII